MLRRLLDQAGLWSGDRLRIFMHPQQLVAVRISRNKIVLKKIVSCLVGDSVSSNGGGDESWSSAITALSALLREEDWQDAKPQLVLSNHFVRYALIPWNAGLDSHAERQAFLRHNFQTIYGDAARSWDLRISDNGMYRAALASGVEQRLLMDLHAVFQNAGFKAVEIYPHFMMAINQAQKLRIEPDAYWFAVVESGRLCVALIQDGHWRSIKSCACSADIPWQISMLIERESVISGIATDGWPVVMYWPGRLGYQEVNIAGRAVDWVRTPDLYPRLEKSRLKIPMHAAQQNSTPDELVPYELALWT